MASFDPVVAICFALCILTVPIIDARHRYIEPEDFNYRGRYKIISPRQDNELDWLGWRRAELGPNVGKPFDDQVSLGYFRRFIDIAMAGVPFFSNLLYDNFPFLKGYIRNIQQNDQDNLDYFATQDLGLSL